MCCFFFSLSLCWAKEQGPTEGYKKKKKIFLNGKIKFTWAWDGMSHLYITYSLVDLIFFAYMYTLSEIGRWQKNTLCSANKEEEQKILAAALSSCIFTNHARAGLHMQHTYRHEASERAVIDQQHCTWHRLTTNVCAYVAVAIILAWAAWGALAAALYVCMYVCMIDR